MHSEQTGVHHHTFIWWMDQQLVIWVLILSMTTHYFVYNNTLKKPTVCKNVSDLCYAYIQVLFCTLNWSRLHNFIHDILLWAKTVWRSHTVEVSTKNCLWMGWRFAASCKKVRTLGQSTPFHEPRFCRVWIARFIHHTAKASVTKCYRNKFSCKKEPRQHCKMYPNFSTIVVSMKPQSCWHGQQDQCQT